MSLSEVNCSLPTFERRFFGVEQVVHSENLENSFSLDFMILVDHANVDQVEVHHEVLVAHEKRIVGLQIRLNFALDLLSPQVRVVSPVQVQVEHLPGVPQFW